jgi:hypothetical protein
VTIEEAKQLKIRDRIQESRYPWWEIVEIVERGVVVIINPKESWNPHRHIKEWASLTRYNKI